jgi:DNA-binding MarR family transcriptional regulator
MSKSISLNQSEAACLTALRSGTVRKVMIAQRARLNLQQTRRALARLASLDIAAIDADRTWYLTQTGQVADVLIAQPEGSPGRKSGTPSPLGPTARRLLALLDQPRHGTELRAVLGVTRQRVHQLVIELLARDLIRSGDPDAPGFVIARKQDETSLLPEDQERVLSAFPDCQATTLSKIARISHMDKVRNATAAEALRQAGLIERTGTATHGGLYRLTATGAAHWQRSAAGRHADAPPLPFRSERVRDVLALLETVGPTRIRDVGLRLDVAQQSINALMQCLKRKKMVRPESAARNAPYELTPEGRDMLAAMRGKTAAVAAT